MEMHNPPCELDLLTCQRILSALPGGLAVFDGSGALRFINRTAAGMLCCDHDPAAAQAVLLQQLDADPLEFTAAAKREVRINDKHYHAVIAPLHAGRNRAGTAVFLQEASLLQETEALTSDFVSVASHELRNPLTALRHALEILRTLQEGGNREQQEKFLAIAGRNADRIAGLINEYLDIAKIETGREPFAFEKLRLKEFLGNLLPEFHEQAARKGITLQSNVPESLPPVFADPRRIEQVFFNLLGNALKFTPAGGSIVIAASEGPAAVRPGGAGPQPPVLISVSDTGIGIPQDKRKRIFEKFYRVQRSDEINQEGVGLGLAIAKKIIVLHGGDMYVEDNPPAGSRFCFTLPVCSGERRDPNFRPVFDREFRRARRHQESLSLFVIVLENLQTLQAERGAGTAAAVLSQVKDAIRTSLHRTGDVVTQRSDNDLLVVFCETEKHGAQSICRRLKERIVQRLQQHAGAPEQDIRIRIGCATYPQDADNQRDLFRQAVRNAQEDAHGTKENSHC